jgi:AcrR family transcriptional regulator
MHPDALLADLDDPPSKRELLACALRLFVHKGLCETSIRDIALAAGYTNPALYKFFASKDALALHLFERCYDWLYAGLTQAGNAAFEPGLQAFVVAWAELVQQRLDAVLFVNERLREFWPHVSPGLRRKSLVKYTSQLVQQGQREGLVPNSIKPELGVALLLGTLGQVARQLFFENIPTVGDARALAPQLHGLLHAALTGRQR